MKERLRLLYLGWGLFAAVIHPLAFLLYAFVVLLGWVATYYITKEEKHASRLCGDLRKADQMEADP